MTKRILDILISFLCILMLSPIIILALTLVWLEDGRNPLYLGRRVGKDFVIFKMVKIRSMVMDADRSGLESTSSDDERITFIGQYIRRLKLDEILQLWNVLAGDMSLVGPRPNTLREVQKYTEHEKLLLTVKPGITDFSSVLFSNEGELLKGTVDPELHYEKYIRPLKSKLGLFYIDRRSNILDVKIILITAIGVFSRTISVRTLFSLLKDCRIDTKLLDEAARYR